LGRRLLEGYYRGVHLIIDSQLSPHDAIQANPEEDCPEEIFHGLGLMEVHYWGFDGNEHQGQIVVSIHVMPEVDSFFRQAYDLKFPIERVVPLSHPDYRWDGPKVLRDNVSAGFDYRTIKDTDTLSLHSRGLAFDINPHQNPYIIYRENETKVYPKNAKWQPKAPGTLYPEHKLVKLMEGWGWEWGGHWTPESGRTDYMHFQKDLDT
jgi:peptidoglycan L-alanyl-D-glutamate endopeptidase CwlK